MSRAKKRGSRVTHREWNALLPKHASARVGFDTNAGYTSQDQIVGHDSVSVRADEAIPPFSIFTLGTTQIEDQRAVYRTAKKLDDQVLESPYGLYTNGSLEIDVDGSAFAVNEYEPFLIRSDDVLTHGKMCGPSNRSWFFHSEGSGFVCISNLITELDHDVYWVIKTTAYMSFLAKGAVTGRDGTTFGSGDVTIQKRDDADDSLIDTGVSYKVYNSYKKCTDSDELSIVDPTMGVGLTIDPPGCCVFRDWILNPDFSDYFTNPLAKVYESIFTMSENKFFTTEFFVEDGFFNQAGNKMKVELYYDNGGPTTETSQEFFVDRWDEVYDLSCDALSPHGYPLRGKITVTELDSGDDDTVTLIIMVSQPLPSVILLKRLTVDPSMV